MVSFKITTQSDRQIQPPSQSEVVAASHPKKATIATVKKEEREKAGKKYTLLKCDAAPHKAVNWKSPTFWPITDMAAQQQVRKPNHSELIN